MKIARKVAAVVAAVSGITFAGPGAMTNTASKVVKNVQIQNFPTGATYYFTTEGGWQAYDCNNVTYAFINESDPGAKAILATVLASKAAQTPIAFAGICGDSGGDTQYLQIRYTTS